MLKIALVILQEVLEQQKSLHLQVQGKFRFKQKRIKQPQTVS